MGRIAVVLRQQAGVNLFREIVEAAFRERKFKTLHVASGFFQELHNFSAAASLVSAGSPSPRGRKVVAVGVYNGYWAPQFDQFVQAIRKIPFGSGTITVEKRKPRGLRWHAKTFIAHDSKGPVLAVIGSSNMTRPAFDKTAPWNYEADSIIWDDQSAEANRVIQAGIGEEPLTEFAEVFVAKYDPDHPANGGRSIRDRMAQLASDLEANTEIVG